MRGKKVAMIEATTPLHPLSTRLATCLAEDGRQLDSLHGARPADWRDLVLTLLILHDLHTAPLDSLDGAERFQHHPVIADLKWRLDAELVAELDRRDEAVEWDLPDGGVAAMRALGVVGLVPPVYDWLAEVADKEEMVAFLALEGGPDGGFDDLVAVCQVGLDGTAKLELAQNYWDEMGNGALDRVHTELHHKLRRALALPTLARSEQPTEALERSALASLLATNRALQPEMLGALGLLELQAGPRCRKAVKALRRIGAGPDALDFYEEHASADPRHGKDWVEKVVAPFEGDARWTAGIIRGARWRSLVNERFFGAMHRTFADQERQAS